MKSDIFNKMWCSVTFLFLLLSLSVAREISDEELQSLPRLFHLDDYERCLTQKEGVYCMGTFELTPKKEPNPAYEIMTERSKIFFTFDRRLLHRGYCLSKRCQFNEKNTTLRFEQCVEKLVQKQGLSTRLKKLSYCKTYAERKAKLAEKPDLPQRIFVFALYGILLMNVLGTLHELYGDGKNKLLLAWSIPGNCRSLFAVDDAESTFSHVHSAKVILHGIIIYTHSTLAHYLSYVHNPEEMEKSRYSFVNIVIKNGTSLVQIFILLSSFFTGYNVLGSAQRSPVTGRLITKWIVKRIFRIAPVYFLLTAYSATWWPRYGDGPQWTPLVEAESQICRDKFWTHLFFVNNFVNPSELCMVQSWAMAAEVQLFLISVFLTLLFMKLRVRAVPMLSGMFAASCLFNVSLAYFMELVPMVKIIVPELLRVEFRGSNSFFHLHVSPWSNLPACLFGLLLAHIYFEQKNKKAKKINDSQTKVSSKESTSENNGVIQKRVVEINDSQEEKGPNERKNGICVEENETQTENVLTRRKVAEDQKNNEVANSTEINEEKKNGIANGGVLNVYANGYAHQNKNGQEDVGKSKTKKAPFLLRYAHCFTFPTLIWWVVWGTRVIEVESKALIALYVGLERLIFSLTFAVQLFQVITVKGPWAQLLSWRGWTVPARLVLSVAMVHWCVNLTIAAGRPVPINSSLLYVSVDWLATMFYSYVIAIPLSLFLELPMKKFGDALVSTF